MRDESARCSRGPVRDRIDRRGGGRGPHRHEPGKGAGPRAERLLGGFPLGPVRRTLRPTRRAVEPGHPRRVPARPPHRRALQRGPLHRERRDRHRRRRQPRALAGVRRRQPPRLAAGDGDDDPADRATGRVPGGRRRRTAADRARGRLRAGDAVLDRRDREGAEGERGQGVHVAGAGPGHEHDRVRRRGRRLRRGRTVLRALAGGRRAADLHLRAGLGAGVRPRRRWASSSS